MIDVSIVVANYNTVPLLTECIRSIYGHTRGLEFEIIVIDDSSPQGGIDKIEEAFPNVKVIKNGINLGYAESNNIGFALAKGEYVLLLNPDTLLHDNAIKTLRDFMDGRQHIYACGAQLLNKDGSWQMSAGRFPCLKQAFADALFLNDLFPNADIPSRAEKQQEGIHRVQYVSGADLFIRRSSITTLYDARIFDTYSEDLDLGYRMRDWSAYIVPGAEITHYGGGSFAGADGMKKRLKLIHSGTHRFLVKHHGQLYSFLWRMLMAWHYSVKTAYYIVAKRGRIRYGVHSVKNLLFPEGSKYDFMREYHQQRGERKE